MPEPAICSTLLRRRSIPQRVRSLILWGEIVSLRSLFGEDPPYMFSPPTWKQRLNFLSSTIPHSTCLPGPGSALREDEDSAG